MAGNGWRLWTAGILAGLTLSATTVLGGEDFPIAGTYMQNKPCRGDGTDPKPLQVRITAEQISYAGGVCSLSDIRQDGNKITVRAVCRSRNGKVLVGDVTFTIRDETTLDMVDQDNTYTAVLNKCPE